MPIVFLLVFATVALIHAKSFSVRTELVKAKGISILLNFRALDLGSHTIFRQVLIVVYRVAAAAEWKLFPRHSVDGFLGALKLDEIRFSSFFSRVIYSLKHILWLDILDGLDSKLGLLLCEGFFIDRISCWALRFLFHLLNKIIYNLVYYSV